MIRLPAVERVSSTIFTANQPFDEAALDFYHGPSWDGGCTECSKEIGLSEPYWEWCFTPSHRIRMHIDCFKVFAKRVTKAASELEEKQ